MDELSDAERVVGIALGLVGLGGSVVAFIRFLFGIKSKVEVMELATQLHNETTARDIDEIKRDIKEIERRNDAHYSDIRDKLVEILKQ